VSLHRRAAARGRRAERHDLQVHLDGQRTSWRTSPARPTKPAQAISSSLRRGDLTALRFDNWKFVFLEQRCVGPADLGGSLRGTARAQAVQPAHRSYERATSRRTPTTTGCWPQLPVRSGCRLTSRDAADVDSRSRSGRNLRFMLDQVMANCRTPLPAAAESTRMEPRPLPSLAPRQHPDALWRAFPGRCPWGFLRRSGRPTSITTARCGGERSELRSSYFFPRRAAPTLYRDPRFASVPSSAGLLSVDRARRW